MDEEYIDSWYDEEKEKAMSEYLEELNKNQDKNKAEEEYKQKLKLLREKYSKMNDKCIKRKNQKDILIKKIEKLKEKVLRIIPYVKK